MTIRTFGDLKRHLAAFDIEAQGKRFGGWLDSTLKPMPGDVVAIHLEWDLVGGGTNDELVADLFGYKLPGLDPAAPGNWDWSSSDQEQFQFLGLGAIWSEAVEKLTDDEVPDIEEALASTIDAIVRSGAAASREIGRRRPALKFYWSRRSETPVELEVRARVEG